MNNSICLPVTDRHLAVVCEVEATPAVRPKGNESVDRELPGLYMPYSAIV